MKTNLLMKFLIASETVFFLCLIVSFLFFRSLDGYHPGIEKLSPSTTGIYSILLLGSSLTFFLTERSFKKGSQLMLKLWLGATIVLGTVFMYGQGKEYYKLVTKDGITVDESVFGTNFYTLTGFHSLHVIMGLIALAICMLMALAGDFKDRSMVTLRAVGWYWHFVDAVWVVVFTVVYLIPSL